MFDCAPSPRSLLPSPTRSFLSRQLDDYQRLFFSLDNRQWEQAEAIITQSHRDPFKEKKNGKSWARATLFLLQCLSARHRPTDVRHNWNPVEWKEEQQRSVGQSSKKKAAQSRNDEPNSENNASPVVKLSVTWHCYGGGDTAASVSSLIPAMMVEEVEVLGRLRCSSSGLRSKNRSA